MVKSVLKSRTGIISNSGAELFFSENLHLPFTTCIFKEVYIEGEKKGRELFRKIPVELIPTAAVSGFPSPRYKGHRLWSVTTISENELPYKMLAIDSWRHLGD